MQTSLPKPNALPANGTKRTRATDSLSFYGWCYRYLVDTLFPRPLKEQGECHRSVKNFTKRELIQAIARNFQNPHKTREIFFV